LVGGLVSGLVGGLVGGFGWRVGRWQRSYASCAGGKTSGKEWGKRLTVHRGCHVFICIARNGRSVDAAMRHGEACGKREVPQLALHHVEALPEVGPKFVTTSGFKHQSSTRSAWARSRAWSTARVGEPHDSSMTHPCMVHGACRVGRSWERREKWTQMMSKLPYTAHRVVRIWTGSRSASRDLKPQIGHNSRFQAPTSARSVCAPSRAQHTARRGGGAELRNARGTEQNDEKVVVLKLGERTDAPHVQAVYVIPPPRLLGFVGTRVHIAVPERAGGGRGRGRGWAFDAQSQ